MAGYYPNQKFIDSCSNDSGANLSPYDCNQATQKAQLARPQYDCPPPERQGLTTTVEHLYQTAADTLSIAERLGVIIDPQQLGAGAQCAEGGNNSVAPHFCEYIDLAADRLHATNRILNRLVDFVGR